MSCSSTQSYSSSFSSSTQSSPEKLKVRAVQAVPIFLPEPLWTDEPTFDLVVPTAIKFDEIVPLRSVRHSPVCHIFGICWSHLLTLLKIMRLPPKLLSVSTQSQVDSLSSITPRYGQNFVCVCLFTFLRLLDWIEAKTKSGSFLTKSCGGAPQFWCAPPKTTTFFLSRP